ncbi:hypothetical protein IMZ48_09495 [Candidatus Bathyarchaeota archaeon]|nr:hypothetical protein [Candidatus Bathyarchaeota archaeon]
MKMQTKLGNVGGYETLFDLLRDTRTEFRSSLGESLCFSGMAGIALSLFSNKNGLWEYSPYLCGVGLMEVL